MARRLLPVVVLLPLALASLYAVGVRAGLFDVDLGMVVFLIALIAGLLLAVWHTARFLDHHRGRDDQLLLQTIVDNSPAVIYAKDLQGRYLLVNERFHDLMGLAPAQVVGKTDFDFFQHADAAAFRAMDERAAAAERPIYEEEVLPRDDGPAYFLSAKAPLRDRSDRVYGTFGISTNITERKRAERERDELLSRERESRDEVESLYAVARTLASERDFKFVVQHVTDAATRLTGAQIGAFFHNVLNDAGENYLLFTLSGAPREAFERFGNPRNTALFAPIFRGEGTIRLGDVLQDHRYGKNPPHHGMPAGHPPVRSFLAVPVVGRAGNVIGGLFFGHADPDVFGERAERIALGIAAQAAVAADNAALHERIQTNARRLEIQLGQLRLLDEVTRAIGQRQDLSSIHEVVMRKVEDQLPADFVCLARCDASSSALRIGQIGAKSGAMASAMRFAPDTLVEARPEDLSPLLRGQLVHEPDCTSSPLAFVQRFAAAGLHSLVIAPLLLDSRVVGVFIVARREARAFTSVQCEFLRQLCDHVALATHQVQLHESLQQAYDELRQSQQTILQQERLRALGQMASGIAHDINNAISPAALYTDSMLEREGGLSERGRDSLNSIRIAIADVAHTVSRMREFYRPRDDQRTLAPVDLAALVNEVVQLTRPRWLDMPQEKGIAVRVEVDLGEVPPLRGAPHEIRDSITNLLFNAVDAMPRGGIVTLRTRRHVESTAPAGGVPSSRAMLEVSDTGVGMDAETRRRCLEPFFTTKGERGTGLGLAMVYGMAQRHGADLEIDSTPGAGTTITVRFPPAHEEAAALSPETRTAAQTVPQRRLNMLIIDDDAIFLSSITDILMQDGHTVTRADSGREGIEQFAAALGTQKAFDIVMTDLGMPNMDGRRVAAALGKLSPDTPVILLTGWGQRMIDENDRPPHVDRVMGKPPRLQELRAVLNALTQPKS